MNMLTSFALIFQTLVGVEIRELNGFHSVAKHFEGKCAKSFDIDSLIKKFTFPALNYSLM